MEVRLKRFNGCQQICTGSRQNLGLGGGATASPEFINVNVESSEQLIDVFAIMSPASDLPLKSNHFTLG
jgi:hypothetical protein